MKKLLLLNFLFFCLLFPKAYSQDFLGLSTGNYSGITGVMLQPASIVDSRFKFDINLFSTGVNYSNNYFMLDRNVILKFNKNKYEDYNTFKDRYLSEASLAPGEKAFFNINNRVQLPLSFMVTTGKKSAVALNMQFRTIVQGRNITQEFANLAFNNFNPSGGNPTIDASGISINSLSWAEAGLTYGRVIYESGNHYLKMAVTGKYLAGLSSISLSANDLKLQVNNDSSFNFNSSNVSYAHSTFADFNKLFNRDLSSNATAFGFDAGLVYEFRGNLEKFKYIKGNDEKSYDAIRRDVSKYIFKVGVSLLDVGMFQFDKPSDVNSFSANINNWDIKNAHYKTIKDFDKALASRVVAIPKDPRIYNVYLPSALSAQLDIKFVKGLFLNAMSYWPVELGSSAGQRFDKFGYYTITPRYETRHFGIYIPYTVIEQNQFTDYKNHLLGLTLRAGPLFIGSSNLGSMLFKEKLRAADVHLGLKVGFTYGKPNKSNKILSRLFENNQTVISVPVEKREENQPNNAVVNSEKESKIVKVENIKEIAKPKQDDNRGMILDYKTQKVYDNPDVKQNLIVINNNYYYGNAPSPTKSDTVAIQSEFPTYNADNIRAQSLEVLRLQNKRISDSIYKITKDSLEIKRIKLDSLIKSMQRLQIEMNSNNQIMDSINNSRAIESPTALNKLKTKNSSENIKQDSLQTSALMVRKINTSNDQLSASASVTKSQDVPDSLQSANNRVQKTAPLTNRIDTIQNSMVATNLTTQVNDKSVDFKKKDTLVIDRNSKQVETETALINSKENNVETAKKQDGFVTRNAESLQRVQSQENQAVNSQNLKDRQNEQDQLYKKYSTESARLGNEIDLLNKRLSTNQTGRSNVNYVPVPVVVPNNNSRNYRQEERALTSLSKIRDTIYIRDTLIIHSKELVQNTIPDTIKQIIKIRETKTDTIKVKSPVKTATYDYAGMPEDHILFGIGKSAIQPIFDNRLNYIANILRKNPDLQVTITGHTDATGSKAINEKLSMQRADAVSYYLLKKEVPAKQIVVNSLASEDPAVSGSNQTARSQNRRVVLKLKSIKN